MNTNDASVFNEINVAECYCNIGIEFHPEDSFIPQPFREIVILIQTIMDVHNIKPYKSLITQE